MDLNNLNLNKKSRKKPPVDLSTMVYGKVPPQARELEAVILGAIMLEKGAYDKAAEVLRPECFYLEAHQRIFKAMTRLHDRSDPIDILTVVEELKTSEDLDIAGGVYGITKLENGVVSSANLPTHARIVYQKYVAREVIRICGEAIGAAYEDSTDPFDLLNEVEGNLSSLAISRTITPYTPLGEVAKEAAQVIYEAKQSGAEVTGVPSGIRSLDLVTMGWQAPNLIILAARPGIGKSALAGNFAFNAATAVKPVPVGVFSLEMKKAQWVTRLLSASTRIPMYDLKRGNISDDQMKQVHEHALLHYPQIPIYFDDTSSLDIYELKSKARMMVLKEKVGLIILDYLQLMSGKKIAGENREQEVSRISRELKHLAMELNIPIIALAQFNREADKGDPRLSHLRESGAIEQDADDVFFLTPAEDAAIQQDASLKDSILVHIAKHRNGTLENIPIKFVKGIQKIMSEQEYDAYVSGRIPLGANWKSVGPAADPNKFTEPGGKSDPLDLPF